MRSQVAARDVCVCARVIVCAYVSTLFTPQFALICKLSETIFKRLYAAHSNVQQRRQAPLVNSAVTACCQLTAHCLLHTGKEAYKVQAKIYLK